MGREGHPEFAYRSKKQDALDAAEEHVKAAPGNKATVVKSKTGIVIHTFNSESDFDGVRVHKENIPYTHRDGIHNFNRAPGITSYRWNWSNMRFYKTK